MNEDKIIETIVNLLHDVGEIKEYLKENVMTKKDKEELLSVMDELLRAYKKGDQETTFLHSRVKRVEDRVDKHDEDIGQIKVQLQAI